MKGYAIGLGPAPNEDAETFCLVSSHKSRAVLIKWLRKGDCMRAAFESAEEMHDWIGKGALKPFRTRDGITLWLTDKIRKCNSERGSWLEPAGKWIGYRWMGADPLIVEVHNARLQQLVAS